MKQKIKKMLLILMVSIGIMGTVSVQAQTQEKVWVKVSDFWTGYFPSQGIPNITGSVDQLCQYITDNYTSVNYTYTGTWNWMFDDHRADVRCHVTSKETSITGLWLIPYCSQGGQARKDPIGCYKQQDTCPEGTVNEGGVCVVPQPECPQGQTWDGEECLNECEIAQKQGVKPPQGCPECPEEPPLKNYVGLVKCDLRGEIPCAWYADENIIPDPDAREKYKQCTIRHEKRHIANSKCFGSFCSVYGYNMGEKPSIYQDEMIAYKESFDCLLEKEKECTTEECSSGIEKLKNNTLARIASFYNKYCNHKGTNCKSKGFEFKCIYPDLKPIIN